MLGLILGPGYVSHVLGSACYMGSLPTHPCLLVTPFGHWAVAPCSLYLDSSFGEGGLGLTQSVRKPFLDQPLLWMLSSVSQTPNSASSTPFFHHLKTRDLFLYPFLNSFLIIFFKDLVFQASGSYFLDTGKHLPRGVRGTEHICHGEGWGTELGIKVDSEKTISPLYSFTEA